MAILGTVGIPLFFAEVLPALTLAIHFPGKEKAAPPERPFEFFYLDINRVGAYLAQINGGTDVKERIGEKAVRKANGEVVFESAFKAGVSTENENFVEREVTPTVANSFVKLTEKLSGELSEPFIGDLSQALAGGNADGEKRDEAGEIEEGAFVEFRSVVQAPAYLNLYLTVHHAATLGALYPALGDGVGARKATERQRRAARDFEEQVGRNPRAVLALDLKGVKVLLPVRLRQLNEERSLLGAGGEFTIIGKLIRVFRKGERPYSKARYAYVDALTRALWKQPLVHAPKGLICRAMPRCLTAIEEFPGKSHRERRERAAEIHEHLGGFRRKLLRELKSGTEIENTGAVILPIAIYR